MSEREIIREIVAKYRWRMKTPPDTMYVVGSISSEERNNLEVLREMQEEMARRLPGPIERTAVAASSGGL